MMFDARGMGKNVWPMSCNWCVCEVAPRNGEGLNERMRMERENGEVRHLMQRVGRNEGVDGMCTGDNLKHCVCKAEYNALNGLWASVVSHVVSHV